jgi:hypothetical protein
MAALRGRAEATRRKNNPITGLRTLFILLTSHHDFPKPL